MISPYKKSLYLIDKYRDDAKKQALQMLWMAPVYHRDYWNNVIKYIDDKRTDKY